MSASALSRQMQILEQSFGSALFVRVPQGVRLTARGETLLAQAQRWLDEEVSLRATMRETSGAERLRLGVMECLVPFITDQLIAAPATISVRVGTTDSLIAQLRRNEIDAIMAFNVPRLPELRVHDERTYELGIVYTGSMMPKGTAPFRLEDCVHLPLCLPDTSMSVWPRLDAEIYRLHAEPQIVLRTNSITLLTDYVAKGAAVSFLTSLDAAAGRRSGQLLFAKLANRRLSERLFLCSAINSPLLPHQAAISEAIFNSIPAA